MLLGAILTLTAMWRQFCGIEGGNDLVAKVILCDMPKTALLSHILALPYLEALLSHFECNLENRPLQTTYLAICQVAGFLGVHFYLSSVFKFPILGIFI